MKKGVPLRDKTLEDKQSVFQLMKGHYSRYTIDKVSDITGVSQEDLMRVWQTFAATGKKGKAGAICYALGWTQHTVGGSEHPCLCPDPAAFRQHRGGRRRY